MRFAIMERYDVEAADPQQAAELIERYKTDFTFNVTQRLLQAKAPDKCLVAATIVAVECVELGPEIAPDRILPLSRGRLLVELSRADSSTDRPVFVDLELGKPIRAISDVDEMPTGLFVLTTGVEGVE